MQELIALITLGESAAPMPHLLGRNPKRSVGLRRMSQVRRYRYRYTSMVEMGRVRVALGTTVRPSSVTW